MSESPYQPPKRAVSDPSQPPPEGSILKGVLIGGAVDLAGTALLGLALGTAYAVAHGAPGMDAADFEALAERYAAEAASLDSAWGWTGVVLGSALSLVGGYLCARFAREKWKNGVAVLGLAMAAFGLFAGGDLYSLGQSLSLAMLTFGVVCAGGWLYAHGAEALR